MKCIDINNNGVPENGSGPITAYAVGIFFQFLEAQADLTNADALLQQTWQDFLYQAVNRNFMLVFDDATDIGENEQIVAEYSEVSVVLGSKQGTDSFKIIADECALRTLIGNFKTSTEIWGYYLTKDNKIRGQKGSNANTLAPIKFRVTANYIKATPESPELVELAITPDEDYIENVYSARPTWSFKKLTATRNVEFVDNGSSTAALIVEASFCGDCDASSLDVTKFITLDGAGADVTSSGAWTRSGYTYTFTPSAPPLAADTYTADYVDPETSLEPYVAIPLEIAVS